MAKIYQCHPSDTRADTDRHANVGLNTVSYMYLDRRHKPIVSKVHIIMTFKNIKLNVVLHADTTKCMSNRYDEVLNTHVHCCTL